MPKKKNDPNIRRIETLKLMDELNESQRRLGFITNEEFIHQHRDIYAEIEQMERELGLEKIFDD